MWYPKLGILKYISICWNFDNWVKKQICIVFVFYCTKVSILKKTFINIYEPGIVLDDPREFLLSVNYSKKSQILPNIFYKRHFQNETCFCNLVHNTYICKMSYILIYNTQKFSTHRVEFWHSIRIFCFPLPTPNMCVCTHFPNSHELQIWPLDWEVLYSIHNISASCQEWCKIQVWFEV